MVALQGNQEWHAVCVYAEQHRTMSLMVRSSTGPISVSIASFSLNVIDAAGFDDDNGDGDGIGGERRELLLTRTPHN